MQLPVDVFILEHIGPATRGGRGGGKFDLADESDREKLMRLIVRSIKAGDDVEICASEGG